MERTLAALEGWPLNIGMQAGARAIEDGHLDALVDAGALGFKIHEDNGAYPELIDHVLRYVDARDLTLSLHTDGLQESAELEDTVAAIAGRTVHAYHVEGTGGGHVPDLLGLVREPSILCSSTTPDDPVRRAHGRRARPDDRAQPRAVVVRAGRRRARPRAGPGGADGRGGAAPRARRDRDRQLRLAGDGPDRGDGPAHVPAGPRDEGVAAIGGRLRDPRPAAGPGLRRPRRPRRHGARPALPGQGDDRTGDHPRAGRARRLAASRPARRPRDVEARLLRRQARVGVQGRFPGVGPDGRGQRDARAGRADPLPGGLGRRARRRRRRSP